MPNVVVIAGPNGAGKSPLAPALLRDMLAVEQGKLVILQPEEVDVD